MTSLLDIGPLTEDVAIGAAQVTVRGVTPEGFFFLLSRFPALRTIFDKSGSSGELSPGALQAVAPGCIAFTLAVSTTDRSRYDTAEDWVAAIEAAAKVAVNLSAHHQMQIFQSALRLTFPDGIGPFVKAMEALANSINHVSGKAPATTSSRRSRSGFTTDSRGIRLGQGARSGSSTH
jgi:hypothetical protein